MSLANAAPGNNSIRNVRIDKIIIDLCEVFEWYVNINITHQHGSCHTLERKDHIKYLGVMIHSTLIWKNHISHVCAKLSQNTGVISKLWHYLPLPGGGGGDSHMGQTGMLVGNLSFIILNFEFNP